MDADVYCGPLKLGFPTLLRAWLTPLAFRRATPFDGRRHRFTFKARTAIDLGCRALGLGPDDEVLVPAYNCGSEIDPFFRRGVRVSAYAVDTTLRIRAAEVERHISAATKCVLLTHYFGWPQPEVKAVAALCKERGIALMEDCAHSLFTEMADGTPGVHGTMAIFSLPKTLPVPDGGAIVLNDPALNFDAVARRPPTVDVLIETARLLKRSCSRAPRRLHPSPNTSRAAPYPEMPQDYYFTGTLAHRRSSRTTRRLLSQFNGDAIKQRRRTNFEYLNSFYRQVAGITPLFADLPGGVCPLVFPMVVDDRASWAGTLRSAGISAIQWWGGFHPGVKWDAFPDACFLKRHVVALPIHQDLRERDIRYMGEMVKLLAAQQTAAEAAFASA